MNIFIVLVVVSMFLNFIQAAPSVDISNDELMDGKYLCEAGSKKFDGPFIVRLISAANGQTVVCYECQMDYKAKYNVKSCSDRIPRIGGNSHHRDLVPYLVRMDPIYSKDSTAAWGSKLKRNFDEIDKASASFSILNQLV